MSRRSRRGRAGMLALASLLSLLCLAVQGAPALAQSPGEPPPVPRAQPLLWHEVADVAIARPVYAVRLVVGIAAFPLAWPVAAILGDPGWAVDVCVRDPADELFRRPLGEL